MMKWTVSVLAAGLLATAAQAADDVTLQLKWVTQAQFAGYFVAKDKGFYDEEGLNVTILPGGPDIAPTQVIAGGGADVMIDWMPSALAVDQVSAGMESSRQGLTAGGALQAVSSAVRARAIARHERRH